MAKILSASNIDRMEDGSTKLAADILPKSVKPAPSIRQQFSSNKLDGWQYAGALFVVVFGLLLSVIETSITATALVSIGNYFNDPIKATWVVLGYLLAYMGFSIIFSRLSDGIGRRDTIILAWVLFGAFSLGGGLARTLNQLIVFRILQGIGGAGLYTMTFVIGPDVTPVQHYGLFSALMGMTYAIGSVLGPMLGGIITEKSSWRWVYLFNAPCAVIGVLACVFLLPSERKGGKISTFSFAKLKSIDFVGATLLLAASTMLVFALQEAGSHAYEWNSVTMVATLTIASTSWIGFLAWISYLSYRRKGKLQPIVPLRILFSRPTGPAILVVLLAGFPYFIAVINLPQRFQIVNGEKQIKAGAHLLPLLFSVALGSFLGAGISSKKNRLAPTSIVAASLILLGCGLFSTIAGGRFMDKAVYGYEVILGLGNGMTFSSITMMVSLVNNAEDTAAAQGVICQARMLGGSIGLAVATIIFNGNLAKSLGDTVTPTELHSLQRSLSTISRLTPKQRAAVIKIYADSFNDQMEMCTYVSIFCLLAALATWQRKPMSVVDSVMKKQDEESVEEKPGERMASNV